MKKKVVKKAKPNEEEVAFVPASWVDENPPVAINPVSVDFGREDLNNLAKKINEIVEYINAQ